MKKAIAAAWLLISFSIYSQPTVGLLENDSLSLNGYTLFTCATKSFLIDNCGLVINQWNHSNPPGLSCYISNQGTLIRCSAIGGSFIAGGAGGLIEEYNWDGDLLWSYEYSNDSVQSHHDIAVMNNGHILLIAWEFKSSSEAIGNGAQSNSNYWPDHILEIEKVGADTVHVVWEWHVWDHLIQDTDPSIENFGVISEHPELIDINAYPPNTGDWNHLNSISFNQERDEIMLSSRTFNEIWIIDHSTTTAEAASHSGGNNEKGGDLLYRWGNPQAYGRGTELDRVLYGPHHASWIPDGAPFSHQISIFNNGVLQPGEDYSSALVINPSQDSEGHYEIGPLEPFGPINSTWIYEASPPDLFFSNNQSGVQGLSNGNFLINSSAQGHIFEVTQNSEIVWDYQLPLTSVGNPLDQGEEWNFLGGGRTFRAERYLSEYEGFNGIELTPGDPIEANPFPSNCIIYSDPLSGLSELNLNSLDIQYWSNTNQVQIEYSISENNELIVYDLSGKTVHSSTFSSRPHIISMQGMSPGIYIFRVTNMDLHIIQVKLIHIP